jgi:very-short-patch-repair endonuclease
MRRIKKTLARKFRRHQTLYEEKVWKILRSRRCLGLKFRRQYVIKGFILDFYCFEYDLAIEIDGAVHLKQKEYDEERDHVLRSIGIKVIRIRNPEIDNDPSVVIKRIEQAIGHALSLRERANFESSGNRSNG